MNKIFFILGLIGSFVGAFASAAVTAKDLGIGTIAPGEFFYLTSLADPKPNLKLGIFNTVFADRERRARPVDKIEYPFNFMADQSSRTMQRDPDAPPFRGYSKVYEALALHTKAKPSMLIGLASLELASTPAGAISLSIFLEKRTGQFFVITETPISKYNTLYYVYSGSDKLHFSTRKVDIADTITGKTVKDVDSLVIQVRDIALNFGFDDKDDRFKEFGNANLKSGYNRMSFEFTVGIPRARRLEIEKLKDEYVRVQVTGMGNKIGMGKGVDPKTVLTGPSVNGLMATSLFELHRDGQFITYGGTAEELKQALRGIKSQNHSEREVAFDSERQLILDFSQSPQGEVKTMSWFEKSCVLLFR